MASPAPRILFVLGKGGVGRSTISTALALAAARRGARALVYEWTIADPIGPWFGREPCGARPVAIAPRLSVMSYALDEALRAYFVDHLRLSRLHRHVVSSAPVRSLVDAAPGIAELLFLGTLWWLTTLAPEEAGLVFDRVIVDVPATGHGASILDMPETLRGVRAAGLLGREIDRVTSMMHDASWTGAVIVSTGENLAIEETIELVPRVTRALGRPPRVAIVNRAVGDLVAGGRTLEAIAARLSPAASSSLAALHGDLVDRARGERRLADALAGKTELGVASLPDLLLSEGATSPRDIVEALREPAAGVT